MRGRAELGDADAGGWGSETAKLLRGVTLPRPGDSRALLRSAVFSPPYHLTTCRVSLGRLGKYYYDPQNIFRIRTS